jgi:hypothetical protein
VDIGIALNFVLFVAVVVLALQYVLSYVLFGSRKFSEINHRSTYSDLCHIFERTLDCMGKRQREDGNERRRQITLHSFRRFVKTTISDL